MDDNLQVAATLRLSVGRLSDCSARLVQLLTPYIRGKEAVTIWQAAFAVINNARDYPIVGTFSNLPDGSTFTDANGTTFKASYSGGTGNDLTLTVQ